MQILLDVTLWASHTHSQTHNTQQHNSNKRQTRGRVNRRNTQTGADTQTVTNGEWLHVVEKGRAELVCFLLLWPVLWAACSRCPSPVERLGRCGETTWQQTESGKRLLKLLNFPVWILLFPGSPLWDRPTLEPTSVSLCSEVCVLLVPFACGQALFSV